MPSVRMQSFLAIEAKLELVREALGWATLVVNPRVQLGEDQLNALVLMYGGDNEPNSLTGFVEQRVADFSVGLMVVETQGATLEQLLDAGFVAVSDALIDPNDIQLDGLVNDVRMGALSDPVYGRSENGARLVGGQVIDFSIGYLAREGDASTPGP